MLYRKLSRNTPKMFSARARYKSDVMYYASPHFLPDRLPDLIRQFQKSNGQEKAVLFQEILLIVERLLKRQMWQLRKYAPHLRKCQNQDLFQAAVVALYRACVAFKVDKFKFTGFPIYVKGYLIREYKKTFSCNDGIVEVSATDDIVAHEARLFYRMPYKIKADVVLLHGRIILDELIRKRILSEDVVNILERRHLDGLSWTEVAKIKGKTVFSIQHKVQRELYFARGYLKRHGCVDILSHLSR